MKNPLSTKARSVGATAAITVGLIAGGAGIAAAAGSMAPGTTGHGHVGRHGGPLDPMGGHAGLGAGVVTAVSANSVTIARIDGTSVSYTLTSDTTYDVGHGSTASAADVTVGTRVFVVTSSTSATSAASIHIEQPHLAGTVQAVSGTSITVTDEQGFWHTVDVGGSTTYTKSGAAASATDVTVGSFVMTTGTIASNHTTLDATTVSIGLPTPGAHGPHGPGGARPMGGDRG